MNHETDMLPNQALDPEEARLLERLTHELRMQPGPELDWDRIEAELMQRTELEAARRRKTRNPSSWASMGAFAAAAAAVVLMIAGASQRHVPAVSVPAPLVVDVSSLPTHPGEPDSLPSYRIDSLTPHSVIESGAEPIQMALDGVVKWTLSPQSRAIVRTTTVPHVIELERGAVFAEVVPRHDSDSIVEAFAVEVDGTRVAVHGTVFSVERVDDLVQVEVTRGTVTVGPSSYRGPTTGLLLSSPARAMFDASTGRFMKRLPVRSHDGDTPAMDPSQAMLDTPTTATPTPAAPPVDMPDRKTPTRVHSEGSSAPETSATSEPTEAPTPAEAPKISVGQAAAIVSACIRSNEKAEAAGVSSSATVKLDADGTVTSVRFNPPLNPKYQGACGGLLFGKRLDASGSVSFGVASK